MSRDNVVIIPNFPKNPVYYMKHNVMQACNKHYLPIMYIQLSHMLLF